MPPPQQNARNTARSVQLTAKDMPVRNLVRWTPSRIVAATIIAVLALLPVFAVASGQAYYVTLASRIMIFGIAAIGVNFALGYVGLVSLGHALYLGIGAYAVGISITSGLGNGWLHLVLALGVGGAIAALVGLICLRTAGFGFVMITLAIAQMFFYFAVGLRSYGGDEGLPLPARSEFAPFDISDNVTFYYVVFVLLVACLIVTHRLVHSRFGLVIRGCKINERRMKALGFSTLGYKLVAYMISAEICVLAGVLLANLTRFTTPSYLEWVMSGDLVVMSVLGGAGTVMGPLVGAAAWITLEEILSSFGFGLPGDIEAFIRTNWIAVLGIVVVFIALALRKGIYGSLVERDEERT
ncbi:branched-chain amino acid ABC transporter permease [Azospirillum endophyticum]